MKKWIVNLAAFIFVFCVAAKGAQAACWVLSDKDTNTKKEDSLRWLVEDVNYGYAYGGCSTTDPVVLQDSKAYYYKDASETMKDWILIQSSETKPTDGNAVDVIKLNANWGPIRFYPKRTLLVGNYNDFAINAWKYDETTEIIYDVNEASELGYVYKNNGEEIKDYGRLMIDARNLDAFNGDNYKKALPFVCHTTKTKVFLRSLVFFLNKTQDGAPEIGEFFFHGTNDNGDPIEEVACFYNAGDVHFCHGEPVDDGNGGYVDPRDTDLTDDYDYDWCGDGCTDDNRKTYYKDRDGDGYGDDETAFESCEDQLPNDGFDYVDRGGDCDDNDPGVNPGASEVCDGLDNDCDGRTDGDDDSLTDGTTYYADTDGDTFGDADDSVVACSQPSGYVEDDTDCDDGNAAINPDAEEICDGADNDCDGLTDGDDDSLTDGTTYYADADSDGFGDAAATTVACSEPTGYVTDDTDCDDTSAAINPEAQEVCEDGVDNNCDGTDDACSGLTDADGDGFYKEEDDCDDGDAGVFPGATEICDDGIDQDCDGTDVSCDPEDCTNEADDDGDGLIDCDDTTDCGTHVACTGGEAEEDCADGEDNDEDGAADCDDADCAFDDACVITLSETDCEDGSDNDLDGDADCDDSDCAAVTICENVTVTQVCSDLNPDLPDCTISFEGGGKFATSCALNPNRIVPGAKSAPLVLGLFAVLLAFGFRFRMRRQSL